ncbi:hypothetical protein O181_127246 [Austropuccinia psidii MF-1]|uniref:Uncharacterized protein n=1 Tax=Austropuccinia psidii MF-1 TaxID=1389203 RepID=A0A9Q3KWN3_9BASI|nr:hypothetical protein [Austropuccinia psidii MF-1]
MQNVRRIKTSNNPGDYGPQLESDSQQPNENLTDSSTKFPQDATSVPPPSSSTHSSKDSAINAVHPVLPIRHIAPLQKRTPKDAPPVLVNDSEMKLKEKFSVACLMMSKDFGGYVVLKRIMVCQDFKRM